MDTNTLHAQINQQLEKLRELHHELSHNPETAIPYAELNEFLIRIRNLYETSLQLQYENSVRSLEELEKAVASRQAARPEPARTQPVPVEFRQFKASPSAEPEEKSVPVPETSHASQFQVPQSVPSSAPETFTIGNTTETAKPAVKNKKVTEVHDRFNETPSLAGRFGNPDTLGHKVAAQQTGSKRVVENLQKKPITDLKAAIGINEKFLFINHLFDGDSNTYHAAIDQLNACESGSAARKLIEESFVKVYNWNTGASPANLFLELIERRFPA